ncbi:GNAT family N-acetyltransferase [Sphingomonas koreensis]|uniref:GNAT family N-acetyltransferase n=1 Tax=Sphingomonas koreensis TaxID=93064 RepID=A0A430G839_9SPHN|nr:GNAT family N-acetyltransferase [Sphingomonas koreensis]RSY89681.1 GNAT family N-acetyltransferase [Sphingomonas koreensis]
MIRKLAPEHYHRILPLLGPDDAVNALSLNAILSGTNLGAVYADDPEQPRTALIDQTGIVSFLVGDPENRAFLDDFDRFLDRQLGPDTLASCGGDTFIAVLHSTAWQRALAPVLARREPEEDEECYFTFAGNAHLPDRRALPAGFSIRRIDHALAANEDIAECLLESWPGAGHFLAHGIGHAVMEGDRAVSLAFSCAAWSGRQEINLLTFDEEDQGRGFATHACAAWLADTLNAGITPHWTAMASNAASLHLARKLGFVETARRPTIEFRF